MKVIRIGLVLGLIFFFAVPAALPFVTIPPGDLLAPWNNWPRLMALLGVTITLGGGVLILALPIGIGLAVLLYRTNLPGRRIFLFFNLLLLAMPMPLQVMGWQAFLGPDGWLVAWANAPGRPWIHGLVPAILIHATAAIPWVVVMIGASLRNVERDLEEDSLLRDGPWQVLWSTTLPRCRGAILAAGVWIALQTYSEVAVTEVLQVNTFAEEIRMRFVLGGGPNLAQALGLAMPAILTTWMVLVGLRHTLERSMVAGRKEGGVARPFLLGRWRWWTFGLVLGWMGWVLFGPTIGLVERLGRSGYPPSWLGREAFYRGELVLRLHGEKLAGTVVVALAAGLLASSLALVISWAMLDRAWLQTLVWSVAALCWAVPGPAAGLGLKEYIGFLVDLWPDSPLEWVLYRAGPLPILWAFLLRFFSCALAMIWPVVRMTPREVREAASLLGPSQEIGLVLWPVARSAFWTAMWAVMALALGEVGAAAIVANPGWDTFAKVLLDAMHFGLDNQVAALGIWLLGSVAVLVLIYYFAGGGSEGGP